MKTLIVFLALICGSLTARADTVTFTLVSPLDSSTPGEVVSFELQQGQAPNLLEACGCGGSPEELNAISAYFNVPILVNGVSETSNVSFCDRSCDNFSFISVLNLGYLGGNSEPWTGLLSAPQFTPGSFQSLTSCFGELLPQSFNSPNTYPLLTIAITTPEMSTLPLVLLGTVFVFTIRRLLPR